MDDSTVTPEKIDELLRFLPLLDRPGRSFVKEWSVGEETQTGELHFPYPIYAEDVWEFFAAAGRPCWSDYSYKPAEAAKMLADDGAIRNATLEQVKTMLTYCVRGERFCDGHWEAMLRTGRVVALLKRLAVLRDAIDGGL